MHANTTRHLRLAIGWAAVIVTLLGAAAPARAQSEPGFSLNRFEPAEMGSDWFSLESLDLRGHGRFSLGVIGNYARKPLVLYDTRGNSLRSPVENQLMLHVGGAIILGDRFRVAASLPVAVINNGDAGMLNGTRYALEEGAAVGDLRLGADLRLFGTYGDLITAAIGAQVHIPTGSRDSYTGDGKVRLSPRLSLAGIAGAFTWAARVGLDGRFQQRDFGNQPFGSELEFGAAAGVRLGDGAVVIGPEFYGSTVITDGGDGFFEEAGTPMEALMGAHFRIARKVRFGVGGGPGIGRTLGSPQYRFLAQLAYFPEYEEADRDGDGIPDVRDACPADPGPERDDPRTNGCPDSDRDRIIDRDDACPREAGVASKDPRKHGCPPPKDSDGDGIVDPLDACPLEPGEPSDDPKKNGCPPPKDSDGDGIVDPLDACPLEPGEPNDDPKKNGCPPPPDSDGDGIVDPDDACPREAGVADPDPKKNGCPPDRDGDRIIDAEDACPDEFGDPDPDPKKNGCPKVQLVDKEIKILERIEFDTGKATIRPESDPVLRAVLRVLKEHPELTRLQVEGHTDSRGAANYNRRLSQSRAESVVAWLAAGGIELTRLVPVGFGEDRPLADNRTNSGRQANRRVQFIILDKQPVPAP